MGSPLGPSAAPDRPFSIAISTAAIGSGWLPSLVLGMLDGLLRVAARAIAVFIMIWSRPTSGEALPSLLAWLPPVALSRIDLRSGFGLSASFMISRNGAIGFSALSWTALRMSAGDSFSSETWGVGTATTAAITQRKVRVRIMVV